MDRAIDCGQVHDLLDMLLDHSHSTLVKAFWEKFKQYHKQGEETLSAMSLVLLGLRAEGRCCQSSIKS